MRRIVLLLLFLSLFQWISIVDANDDLSCYTHEYVQNIVSSPQQILVETQTQDFIAMQWDITLSPIDVWWAYKYIPFESSLSWDSLDTQDTKTIELTINNLSTNNFEIDFRHDAKYHTAKYYISEDGESYSQVTARNIADFRIYKVKIVFTSTTSEEIREIININNLTIERKNYISSLRLNWWENIHFYFNNSCNNNKNLFPKSNSVINNAPIYDILELQEHNLYIRKTTDSDRDNIMDLYDNCISVKNTDQKDINQNWVWDACEFDSDSDGIPDEIDNCRNTPNPDQKDTDKDGIWDVCDNCNLYNPDQRDIDGNKIWDTCDQQKIYELNNDDDSDWILNSYDNCRFIANPDQGDDDNDRIGNSCDNCQLFQNSDQADVNENGIGDICEDSDSDGIDSITDNCINIANPDQADDDNDGVGNLCEDDDNDRVLFSLDNCPYVYNPNQLDTDDDWLWDVCDSDDNRFLESNKAIIILLMFVIIAWFIGTIVMMARKLQK
jgi:hypothetical protein